MTYLLTPGQTLSHYRILQRLGAGAMGEVYKAHDTNLDRPVALKVLLADYVEDKARLRRFTREAKAASALNHPHIITIYEIGEATLRRQESENRETEAQATELQADDTERIGTTTVAPIQYIAMEFVDGETLEKKIHQDRTDLKKLLDYLAQVAEGLAAAHAAGIIHRDLKPENIMIRRDGYAKLLDFGVAKLTERRPGTLVDDGSARSHGTGAGTMVGTVGYMSPEQVHAKPVDHRSDIFSFGCILYEAVARRRAFEGEDVVDSLHKILHQEPPALESLLPGVPPALGQIVSRCLAKNPENRYSSVADVVTRLKELRKEMEGLPPVRVSSGTVAKPESLKEGLDQPAQTLVEGEVQTQPFRWSRRYLGLAICVTLLLAAGVILIPKFTAPSRGTLRMESTPSGAEVYVNEKLRGSTPLPPTELAIGSYRVRLELKGYKSETDTIEITRESIMSRSYRLTPGVTEPQSTEPQSMEPQSTHPQSTHPQSKELQSTEPVPTGGLRGIEVRHPHLFRRDCYGQLFFHGKSIEYRTSGSHAFKLPLSELSELILLPDKIIIESANVPGERVELLQMKRTAKPNLTDFYASVRKNWKG